MEPTIRLAWLALAALACPLAAATQEKGPTMGGVAGGWRKHEGGPVLGGKLGTCFDISVLREGDRFRMWFSWRPKASLALAGSADGLAWGEPKIVLGPNPDTPWEKRHASSVFVHKNALWMIAGNHMGRDVWKLVRAS